jgi:TolB-like protein/class 3 adenylate cyclase
VTDKKVTRRLTTILVADIEGYTRLMRADEEATLKTLGEYRDVIDRLITRHEGRVFSTGGDSVLAEFGSAVEAVRCANSLQEEISSRNAELAEDQKLVFRIGINVGDVMVKNGDLFGDGVNVAARLEGLADPGGVCISGSVFEQVRHKLSLGFEDMGQREVKNIDELVSAYRLVPGQSPETGPLATYSGRSRHWWSPAIATAGAVSLVVGGLAVWQPWEPALELAVIEPMVVPISGKPLIAVLPFDDYGGGEMTARLARGVTEDIITDLARFPEFGVIARNSTEAYAGKAIDPRAVGEALGVGYVLEGSIQRMGEELRITAQLIDAETGTHVWSERWDRQAEDVFAVQTEIAETVANRLGGGAGVIQQSGRAEAQRKRPEDLDAYELYLLGTEKLEKTTKENIQESIRLLTRAVELDPGLARAWVELYHAHSISRNFGAERDSALKAAMEAAERAVELDPGDAEAHAALGSAFADRGEFVRAKASFDTALRMAPNAFEILTFYASWSATLGDLEGGAKFAERAISLNPDFPMWAAGAYSWAFFQVGRYEETLRLLDRQTPENYTNYRWAMRAGSYAALGQKDEAADAVRQALERFPQLTIEGLVSDQSISDIERERFIETMRLAGFPPCAPADARADLISTARLAECD